MIHLMVMCFSSFLNILSLNFVILISNFALPNFMGSLFLILIILETQMRLIAGEIAFTQIVLNEFFFFNYSTMIDGCFHQRCFRLVG